MVQPGVIFIQRPPRLITSSFTSTWTPWCRYVLSVPARNLRPGFEVQTCKPGTNGFEAQTTKPAPMVLRMKPPNPRCWRVSDLRQAWRLCLPSLLDPPASAKCHDTIILHLDLIDAIFITHVHLRLLMSQMSATVASHLASRSLGPSLTCVLHRSRSVGMTRPPWPSPHRRPPPMSSTPTQHKPRDMSHT
jgi:hypothetical protein